VRTGNEKRREERSSTMRRAGPEVSKAKYSRPGKGGGEKSAGSGVKSAGGGVKRAGSAFAVGKDGGDLDGMTMRGRGNGGGRIFLDGAGRVSEDRSNKVPDNDGRYSLSLGHGLAILATFSAERSTLGIAEMASVLSMSRSTTHRYAATLAQLGYLEQNSSRRYRLTPRCADVGLAALGSMALHECSRPYLYELRRGTGWTVSLAILDGSEAMLVERLRGWRGLHEIDLRLGSSARLPVHCTAIGKVLLAWLEESELRELLSRLTLKRHGPHSSTGKRALRATLEEVREQGFALDDEELIDGLRSIAVPVRDAQGKVLAALDLAVPGALFEASELNGGFGALLSSAAEGITQELAR
ncbi:MAG TPA: IclR family transcriptional regulator C-terminal domain-containing protein, partial [Solirubrobacteraceae bacterium]